MIYAQYFRLQCPVKPPVHKLVLLFALARLGLKWV